MKVRAAIAVEAAKPGDAVVAAFAVNELEDGARKALREKLLLSRGVSVLIVEPIARRIHPWWTPWRDAFEERGGRADEWRGPKKISEKYFRKTRFSGVLQFKIRASYN